MCHELKQSCDLDVHLTCHRFRPLSSDDVSPQRLYNESHFYDEYSSGNDVVKSYGSFDKDTAFGY